MRQAGSPHGVDRASRRTTPTPALSSRHTAADCLVRVKCAASTASEQAAAAGNAAGRCLPGAVNAASALAEDLIHCPGALGQRGPYLVAAGQFRRRGPGRARPAARCSRPERHERTAPTRTCAASPGAPSPPLPRLHGDPPERADHVVRARRRADRRREHQAQILPQPASPTWLRSLTGHRATIRARSARDPVSQPGRLASGRRTPAIPSSREPHLLMAGPARPAG
jgi:hypothetical protein